MALTLRNISCLTLVVTPLMLAACGLGDDGNVGNDDDPLSGTGGTGDTVEPGPTANPTQDPPPPPPPSTGGVVCGSATCAEGEFCCNESCSICAPEGGFCTEQFCGGGGVQCGPNTCAEGEVCCNESCGTCTPPDGVCTQELCVDPGGGVQCGPTTCAEGEVCCNESCGTCTPPDGVCTQQLCGGGCDVIQICVEGFTWDDVTCECVPAEPECTSDSDCRLFEFYCDGCNCLGLANSEPDPVCMGEEVNCFAPACMDQTAACENGQCVARR